jgi:spore coat protein U-like protein
MTEEGGTAQLEYSLYLDAAYTNVWTSTNVHNGVGTGVSQTVTIYGRALGGQFVEPDPYYDTVTATINF